MAKKVVKSKMKQKQKQSQNVIVNISQPKTVRRTLTKSIVQKKEQPKQYLPMTPSFNINQAQPQPATDLAKLIGMLIPKLQTESTLGSSIPLKATLPNKPTTNIGGLVNKLEIPTLGDAIEANKVETPEKENVTLTSIEPTLENTLGEETSAEEMGRPKKYDTSKGDQNKFKLLSQLYGLLIINETEENARRITDSFKLQSNKKIKEKINYEKQAKKI
jgi:hypothetical protein